MLNEAMYVVAVSVTVPVAPGTMPAGVPSANDTSE